MAIKILFLARSLGYGGAERQLVELARGLQVRGHEVAVAVFYSGQPLETELRASGVRLHDLAKKGRWDLTGFLARFWRLLRSERPDVLHGYLTVPNLLVALARPALPLAAVVWGIRASNMDMDRYDRLSRLTEHATRRLRRGADLIIVNSQAGLTHCVARGYPASTMIVIDNGVDTERFAPDPSLRDAVRAQWHVRPGERLVGLVGRLDPMKGHPTFLSAASNLARQCPDVRFVCVGDGPEHYASQLRQKSVDLGLGSRIDWRSATPHPARVYNALDVLCSASVFGEGFPNVIAEAMACAVPCVATDVGDSARIVGSFGRTVKPGDPHALGAAIAGLLRDLETGEVNPAAVRAHIVESFSIERLGARTEDALVRALARRRAGTGTKGGAA